MLSIFVISYFIFKSEFVFEGTKRDYYVSYFVISSTYLFISLTLLFFNNYLKGLSLIYLMSILFSLYLFETYLVYEESIGQNKRNFSSLNKNL